MLEKLVFYTRHSLNDLRVNGRRTLFALLCIAAGVAAIVSLQTLGVMIDDTLTGSLREINRGDIRIMSNDSGGIVESYTENNVFGGEVRTTFIGERGLSQLRAWFDENYNGEYWLTYRQYPPGGEMSFTNGISAPDRNAYAPFVAGYIVEAQQYPLYGEVRTEEGHLLGDVLRAPTDIVLARNLADTLNAQVGDTIRLSGATEDFVVQGIVETNSEAGFENILAGIFGYYYLDVRSVPIFNNLGTQAAAVYVLLDDESRVEEVTSALRRDFRSSDLDTQTTEDVRRMNEVISSNLSNLVSVMGLVSLLLGGIGIVNTMQVIVSRRTVEVAVLKTLGLEAEQVTTLFLVEAFLMGVLGSLLGIVLGWGVTFLVKGTAEAFLAQNLAFRIAPGPAFTGLIVGVLVTTIFGFLPTLSAGQVRPGLVLRPKDNIVPKAGRLRSFVALVIVILALSAVAQPIAGKMLVPEQSNTNADGSTTTPSNSFGSGRRAQQGGPSATTISTAFGAILGALIGIPSLLGGLFFDMVRKNTLLKILRILVLGIGLPALGALFGYFVPALLILVITFLVAGFLYVMLWFLIWLIGRFFPTFGFADLKIALRAMLNAKGRGAATLLALVVGVFSLSLITLMVASVNQLLAQLTEMQVGGNVFVFSAGLPGTNERLEQSLSDFEGVTSYSMVRGYEVTLVSMEDASTGETLTRNQVSQRIREQMENSNMGMFGDPLGMIERIEGRSVSSNLPVVTFTAGRQLTPEDAGQPVMVFGANAESRGMGVEPGDRLTFRFRGGRQDEQTVTFEVVGVYEATMTISTGGMLYVPQGAIPESATPTMTSAIVDVAPDQVFGLRQAIAFVPGTFMLESRLLNQLVDSLIGQFTSFPILVAALGLIVGGVVIANSVALATIERRREIAIMKAVGLQRERVLGMLLLENGLMGLVGGLIGVGIGLLMLILTFTAAMPFGGSSAIPYGTAAVLMGLCIVIALVAAVSSAWGASGEKPLNVLRYE